MNIKPVVNVLISLLISCVLVVFAFSFLIHKNFKTNESTSNFLKNANVYINGAQIAKLEIQTYYPKQIKDNPLLRTTADGFLNKYVTPELLEAGTKPAMKSAFWLTNQSASSPDGSIVVDSTAYKQLLKKRVDNSKIPAFLSGIVDQLISAAPNSFVVLTSQGDANVFINVLIKAQMLLSFNKAIFVLLLVVLGILTALLVWNNIKRIYTVFLVLGCSFAVASLAVYLLSTIIPSFLSTYSIPSQTPLGVYQNKLVFDLISYVFALLGKMAKLYMFAAVAGFAIWGILRLLANSRKNKKEIKRKSHVQAKKTTKKTKTKKKKK